MPYKDLEQRRTYAREWVRRRRETFMGGKSCVECGSVERLELDHIDPSLKVDHVIWSWSQRRRDEELAKCQVLCHDCHLRKTRRQNYRPRAHGEPRTYNHGGCRCEPCTEAYSAYRAGLRYERYARQASAA